MSRSTNSSPSASADRSTEELSIFDYIKIHKITQQQLADRVGATRQSVHNWLNGGAPAPRFWPALVALGVGFDRVHVIRLRVPAAMAAEHDDMASLIAEAVPNGIEVVS